MGGVAVGRALGPCPLWPAVALGTCEWSQVPPASALVAGTGSVGTRVSWEGPTVRSTQPQQCRGRTCPLQDGPPWCGSGCGSPPRNHQGLAPPPPGFQQDTGIARGPSVAVCGAASALPWAPGHGVVSRTVPSMCSRLRMCRQGQTGPSLSPRSAATPATTPSSRGQPGCSRSWGFRGRCCWTCSLPGPCWGLHSSTPGPAPSWPMADGLGLVGEGAGARGTRVWTGDSRADSLTGPLQGAVELVRALPWAGEHPGPCCPHWHLTGAGPGVLLVPGSSSGTFPAGCTFLWLSALLFVTLL